MAAHTATVAASSYSLSLPCCCSWRRRSRLSRSGLEQPCPWNVSCFDLKSNYTTTTIIRGRRRIGVGVFADLAQESGAARQPAANRVPPGVDTRIHWENEEEGWIGGNPNSSTKEQQHADQEDQNDVLSQNFSDLLNNSSDSHYQFLGVPPDADLEEIKTAYRRLSKEYHPDTTTLPLKASSDMFMKLREIYDVLSNEEKRKFYDWALAQETASREAEKMRMNLKDPYVKDLENYEPVPDMVDRLGGRNMKLSDQAMTALTFDVLVVVFAICCIIYVAFFKESY